MPARQRVARAARPVVDERDARPVAVAPTTSCPSTVPGVRDADLLDVGAAEPAGEHLERRLRRRRRPRAAAARARRGRPRASAYRRAVAVKLHRCRNMAEARAVLEGREGAGRDGRRLRGRVGPSRPGKRAVVIEDTGQNLYPAIEFENGTWYREESKDMEATIRAGKLIAARRIVERSDRRRPRWR